MALTKEERERILEVADTVFAAVPDLTDTLLQELTRAGLARDDVGGRLSAGAREATTSLGRELFGNADEAQRALCDSTLRTIGDAVTTLVSLPPAGSSEPDTPTPSDPAAALAQLHADEFGLAIAKLFYGFALIFMHASLASYIDECERFLGRPVGSHEARRRVAAVVVALLEDAIVAVPGALVPGLGLPLAFIGALKQGVRQLKTTPQDVDDTRIKSAAKVIDDVATLQQAATRLDEESSVMQRYIAVSVDAVVTEHTEIARSLRPPSEGEL